MTSFPVLAKKYFDKFDTPTVKTSIKYVSGSVEAACGLGLADGVIDLVETGTTMQAAGLEVVSEVLVTEAVLISSKSTQKKEMVDLIRKRILGYMTATDYLMISYNVSRANLSNALKVIYPPFPHPFPPSISLTPRSLLHLSPLLLLLL